METGPICALPPRFADLKREIAESYPDFQQRVTKAWNEILDELKAATKDMVDAGSEYIPQVEFSDLKSLSPGQLRDIQRKGCIVIRNVVDDEDALAWKQGLEEFIKTNRDVEGVPEDNKQFFQLYWTKSQVLARSHPNMLAASAWLNSLYHTKSAQAINGVDLSVPLSYADRFRIRRPGTSWNVHPPHVDGGAIERWEDESFRTCFADILSGNWRAHDPYDLQGRLNARSSLYGRPNQSTVFRTFQGWLALSETAPTEGTLKVFPDVLLANAYIILRPFFKPLVPTDSDEALEPNNWEYGAYDQSKCRSVSLVSDFTIPDITSSEFPGIFPRDGGFAGPRPTPLLHPHLRLDKTMTSVPKVNPGDTVFWHCDVVHSVEEEHTGKGDSAVMYIPSVPLTPQNEAYVKRQYEDFVKGNRPSDFPKGKGETDYIGIGRPEDILTDEGRRAMGVPISVS